MTNPKPRLAIIPGDPSGIGPELIAKLLNEDGICDVANIVLIGDAHVWEQGAQQAGLPVELVQTEEGAIETQGGVSWLPLETIHPDEVRIAEVTVSGGRSSLLCLNKALDLAVEGKVDGVLFAPFNKAALTRAGMNAEDEHRYMARYLGFQGYHSEINVLGDLMTTRVTSHIGLKDVAAHITPGAVKKAIGLAEDTLKRAGKARPHIAVAALNPHAGDNGKFGREEIDILQPVIDAAQAKQKNVTGPWPSDTVFLKARRGEVDAVVTMYHDQGQIAIKLMGFDRGVTVAGGLPIPVATPAHGTAFDIAGQNKANVGATVQAFNLLVRMARIHRAAHVAA
ncbi:4-hydroxythreonine-4-phosphate dehydrogenase [Rhodovulum imhoffii]|uniref:4-hydroxythreonine-4-phosphate dehydrogenase n=1 Tax=Rhodovulum imhoffii TaxID=365340 RepID=A0A2T5BL61_9RHOB|nr:4-hydroxythreonine-4-phosphate dehydrogenase PdxA [Rhodovulum imhoffii]MBK5933764.1 4-hydroxythreonine-4-phosphate dehydrogenase [Rhodovulum imhoffii]PTM99720.1 4-hydroxythreonine-4-phosphate dehydrogenase [Rhodovulum imhoffii]